MVTDLMRFAGSKASQVWSSGGNETRLCGFHVWAENDCRVSGEKEREVYSLTLCILKFDEDLFFFVALSDYHLNVCHVNFAKVSPLMWSKI